MSLDPIMTLFTCIMQYKKKIFDRDYSDRKYKVMFLDGQLL